MAMASPYSDIPPAVTVEAINDLASAYTEAFPTLASQFDQAYTAWKTMCSKIVNLGISKFPREMLESEEFDNLLAMGPAIIPLVVQKLTLPDEFGAVHLYNILEDDPKMKVDPNNLLDSYVLQRQANLVIDMNGRRKNKFDDAVQGWKEHIDRTQLSNSSFARAESEYFDDIVNMGASIIPSVMMMYAGDRDAWWYLVLQEITGAKASFVVQKPGMYRAWEEWFLGGADLNSLP